MRNIFILLVVIMINVQLGYSQESSVYDSYIGTWKWEDNKTNSEFVIILKKGIADWTKFNAGIVDCIIGAYKFKKDGITVVDTFEQISEEKEYILYPIRIFGSKSHMRLSVADYTIKNGYGYTKQMGGSSNIKLIESIDGKTKMQWIIIDDDGGHVYLDAKEAFPKGCSLPTNIILTKVE